MPYLSKDKKRNRKCGIEHSTQNTRARTRARAHTHTHTESEFSLHHSNDSFWEEVGFLGQLVHTAQKMFHLDFPQAILIFFLETQCLFLNRKISVTFPRLSPSGTTCVFTIIFSNTPVCNGKK
jgi:hypothetical protein